MLRVLANMKIGIVVISLTILLLAGCRLFRNNIVRLCTNRPEVAAYVEYFHALNEDIKVELCYRASPALHLLENKGTLDLLLDAWLNGSGVIENFESLEDMFKEGRIIRESFYPDLLASGLYEKKQVLLPLSFNIPTVIFNPAGLKEIPNLIVPLDYLKLQSSAYNLTVRSKLKRMGFSPLWNKDFLYLSSALLGADFREVNTGSLDWNEQALADSVAFLKVWINEINGGYERDEEFAAKYMYEPMSRLLDEKRILFYLSDSGSLFKDLQVHEEEADFRWPAYDQRISVDEGILYAGIPGKAKNRKGARVFLEWLYQRETQARLLEINRAKRLKTFGIAGGFSALWEINEREFPKFYPSFIGRIPTAAFLVFPGPLPADWGKLKREVIIPWLFESVVSEKGEQSLESRIQSFRSENLID